METTLFRTQTDINFRTRLKLRLDYLIINRLNHWVEDRTLASIQGHGMAKPGDSHEDASVAELIGNGDSWEVASWYELNV